MLRLFLSLYLLICIGLVIINLTSTFIFAQFESSLQDDKFNDVDTLAQLTSGYVALLKQQHVELASIQQVLDSPVKLIATEQLAFLPEQQQALTQGQIVSLFSDELHLLLYGQLNSKQLLQIGPIALAAPANPQIKHGVILLSYLMLAVFISLWSQPLWRDLTVLIGMTKQISTKQAELTGNIAKHSVLQPMYQALKQMNQRISELMAIQQQMIHAVSHDIRTPLARMKFTLAMLNQSQQSTLTETKQSLLSDIGEIETLIDNLLSFGKIDSVKIELDKQDVDLSSLLMNLVDKLKPLSDKTIDCQNQAQVHYFCDGHLLERALQNLIANSQKYGNKQIIVSLIKTNASIMLVVEDDGAGIPEQQKERVLQPFARLDKSRNKNSGGFGLGLAIVSRIVQWHNGKLDIDKSQLGGAKITITLF